MAMLLGATYLVGGAPTCENVLESKLDVASVQGRRFNEGKVVLA